MSKTRCYAKANWKLFKEVIEGRIDLINCNIQSKCSIDSAIHKFVTYLHEAENVAVPLQKARLGSYELDPGILSLISLRNYLRRRAQRSHLSYIKKIVNSLNRKIKILVLKRRNEDWNRKLASIPSNSKHVWKVTKTVLNNCNKIPPLKDNSNQLILTDVGKADAISQAFNLAHSITFNQSLL